MRKLTKAAVPPFRNALLRQQGGICPLCKEPIIQGAPAPKDPVLDHDHKTGECRAVLHRGCNAIEGKIENARDINGLRDDGLFENVLNNLPDYLKNTKTGAIHPSHKTPVEKKALAKKRATRRRKLRRGTS